MTMRGGRRERAGGSGVSERSSQDGVHPSWEQKGVASPKAAPRRDWAQLWGQTDWDLNLVPSQTSNANA